MLEYLGIVALHKEINLVMGWEGRLKLYWFHFLPKCTTMFRIAEFFCDLRVHVR